MIITVDTLKAIAPGSKKTNYKLLPDLAAAMNQWLPGFGIDEKGEYCHFLAQSAHETDSFNTLEEYASGESYEHRKDLGNTVDGYGVKYKGMGVFQTTGYYNYQRLEVISETYFANVIPFIKQPNLLKEPHYAIWSAMIYWDDRDFNSFANMPDDGKIWSKKLNRNLSPLEYITWRINGGFNGLEQRKRFYERAKSHIF